MDECIVSSSRSSLEDNESPAQPQNQNSSSSGSANQSASVTERETQVMKREIESLHSRLSQTEALLEIREKSRELLREEADMLQFQVLSEVEMSEQLLCELKTVMDDTLEAREAQMNAEAELFRVKTSMEKKMKELIDARAENLQRAGRETKKKLIMAEQKIMQLEKQLQEHFLLQKEFDRQKMELEIAKITILKLQAEIPEANTSTSSFSDAEERSPHAKNATEYLQIMDK
ncbi:myosin heavy chain, embryonic smooth muscle isoform-like [Fopius arisanus]|uniref:Myosin heavy chain, embryonic smooth muscle isoform-like n=1 Tax=Fopius arisanus TaxID=64838 RepID=A0A9R1STK8_9HYME|nr:PREDICTED: myosin heavy chain, embryonic smooth muscle isoform-like [Fopius arisanus]